MIDYKAVGAFISELRKANGLTQMELAENLNITHQAVSKWENGITLPDTETLFALSKLFMISIDNILNANKSEPQPKYEYDNKNEDAISNKLIKRINETFGATTDDLDRALKNGR